MRYCQDVLSIATENIGLGASMGNRSITLLERQFYSMTDFRLVLWKETLWMNFLRAACALPFLITVSLITKNSAGTPIFFVSYPFMYLFFVVPILFLVKAICQAAGGPLAPLLLIPITLFMISGGDPIVYFLSKVKPEVVPIKNYPFLSFDFAMLVLKEESGGA